MKDINTNLYYTNLKEAYLNFYLTVMFNQCVVGYEKHYSSQKINKINNSNWIDKKGNIKIVMKKAFNSLGNMLMNRFN